MDLWLAGAWGAVWPNLAANLVWIPIVWAAHRAWVTGQRVERQMHTEYIERLHQQHERQIAAIHDEHQHQIRVLLDSKEAAP